MSDSYILLGVAFLVFSTYIVMGIACFFLWKLNAKAREEMSEELYIAREQREQYLCRNHELVAELNELRGDSLPVSEIPRPATAKIPKETIELVLVVGLMYYGAYKGLSAERCVAIMKDYLAGKKRGEV
ncbi:hypothetical protein [Pseudoteredinibacter isoporae]|uniref:hypothetical protein n=1 Tax=Pseudoteredinibacter isoporae TaxID=570281 RepID=UPI003102EF68